MTEFKIINQLIDKVKTDSSVVLGIGDDAAVMDVPEGFQIVQTLDTMVLNVHFDTAFSADALAHKLFHINLSDIAAMGAVPKWATVALTIPTADEKWLSEFSAGLQSRCNLLGVNLVGGDTTSGPLTVSMNVTGLVKQGEFLTRSGAEAGDDVYVSGFLGDAALALTEEGAYQAELINRLRYPEARYMLGEQLYGLASSCIDISDGLLGDLSHICEQSLLKSEIDVNAVPLSRAYQKFFKNQGVDVNPDYALNGGDDYELCFTAHPDKRDALIALGLSLDYPVTRIGTMVSMHTENNQSASRNETNELLKSPEGLDITDKVCCILDGKSYQCQRSSWEHFSEQA